MLVCTNVCLFVSICFLFRSQDGNRLFPTTKQIIDDSLFAVTDYCWVNECVRMFCIGVVIVMLSSDLAWKKVITNHTMWSIFSRLHRFAYIALFKWFYVSKILYFTHINQPLDFSSIPPAPELNTGNIAVAEITSTAETTNFDHSSPPEAQH